jgi:predicted dehydrogenase
LVAFSTQPDKFNPVKPTAATDSPGRPLSRRQFLRNSSLAAAGVATAAHLPFGITAHAAADDPIRVGVIGCGGRGTGAVLNILGAATDVIYPAAGYHTEDAKPGTAATRKGIEVVALADVFPDRLASCRQNLQNLAEPIRILDDHCFTGFDAADRLLALPDVNYVILATPPYFRPAQLMAAVQSGKHVFMEKPVAVDAPGVRMVIAAGDLAKQKGLGIAAGTQRRHQRCYQETIRRLRDGMIGEIVEARAYWNGGEIWVIERKDGWTDMEWQLRNWNYFTWVGGDHIVEQHMHNLDVINWVLDAHPIRAIGQGGRQARTGTVHGHIYDHFAVEFEYPGGVRMFSQCRQINNCDNKVEEAVLGTRGTSNCANWIRPATGAPWRFRDPDVNPYEQEHVNLINSIRQGQPINEARNIAESTLVGILGRESAYSGRTLTWEQVYNSTMKLGPEKLEFGRLPSPEVAIPGRYQFS